MQAVKSKGLSLSGKARRVHKKGRAERLFDQQLVMDYFRPVDPHSGGANGGSPLTVRHHRGMRSPQAGLSRPVVYSTDEQLNLPLDETTPWKEEAICFVRPAEPGRVPPPTPKVPRQQDDREGNGTKVKEPPVHFGGKRLMRILSGRMSRGRADPKGQASLEGVLQLAPKGQSRRNGTFTIRGFLCGCAIGAAAAGVILVFFQAVLM